MGQRYGSWPNDGFGEGLCLGERKNTTSMTASIEDFADFGVQGMNLIDLPLVGRKFTWTRRSLQSRIDCVLVNAEWSMKFKELKLCGMRRSLYQTIVL